MPGNGEPGGNDDGETAVPCASPTICDVLNAYGPPTYIDRISV